MSHARRRQRATGEKYMMALAHVRGQCVQCNKAVLTRGDGAQPCKGCFDYEPCWACRPTCAAVATSDLARVVGRCEYDDLRIDGTKQCSNCGMEWPFTRPKLQVRIHPDTTVTAKRIPGARVSDVDDPVVKALIDDIVNNGIQIPKEVTDYLNARRAP